MNLRMAFKGLRLVLLTLGTSDDKGTVYSDLTIWMVNLDRKEI